MANHLPKFPVSSRDPNLVKLNPKKASNAIEAKVARLQVLMGKQAKDIINEANRQGLAYLQREALKSLRESMEDTRAPFRTGRLEAAIIDDQYSKADGLGIRFLIDALIRKDVPYFAALEYGDHHSVGRQIPFIYLGTKRGGAPGNSPDARKEQYSHTSRPSPNRANGIKEEGRRRSPGAVGGDLKTDRTVGLREIKALNGNDPNVKARLRTRGKNAGKVTGKGVYLVTITRPVPDYHYAQKASQEFLRTRYYNTVLNRLIKGSALDREGVKYVLSGR